MFIEAYAYQSQKNDKTPPQEDIDQMFADARQLYYDVIWMQEQLPPPTQFEIDQMYVDINKKEVEIEGFRKEKERENEKPPTQDDIDGLFNWAYELFEALEEDYSKPFPDAYHTAKTEAEGLWYYAT